MKNAAGLFIAVSSLLAGVVQAGGYDFYGRLRYPEGGKLVPGVDLYKPVQEGKGAPRAYERRTVDWWPRKGVDIVAVEKGMPLREWTWREKKPGRPASFKAHLIAFRGMGNTMSSKFRGDGGPIEPAVVLRLDDGRKRCFLRGSFCDADKAFVMDIFVREMDRIKAGIDKTPRVKRASADVKYPNNAKPGEPGTMQVEAERFYWLSGSQAGSDDDPWVNEKDPEKAEWFRKGSIECADFWWAMNEYAGHLMPHWDRTQQFKYEITVPGTKRDGHQVIPGYAGGGYGACGIKGAGGGPWSWGLFHEWGHGALGNGWRIGGGEAQADMHQCLATPTLKGNHHVTTPWRNIYNGGMGYGYTMFYNIMGDDPNWGYGWFVALPSGAGEQSLMQIAARVGQQRGMFKDGIRGFGDMMGEYGARLATFDCELEDFFRKAYHAPARSWLEPISPDDDLYMIPAEEAPEPYGVNIVRIVPDEGWPQFQVGFQGVHDPDAYGDWRACIVAVGVDGRRRYSPLWNVWGMTMEKKKDDLSHWLVISATPTAIYSDVEGGRSVVQNVYSGRYAHRYPSFVWLTGARPGTPRECRADFGEVTFECKLDDAVPAPHDTPEGKAYLARLKAFAATIEDNGLKSRIAAEIGLMTQGKRHPNGGGWVADTAQVAPTAYVGRDAMVLGHAKVLDQAIVEDFAVITDKAVVSGHARVSGQAIVKGAAKASGYSRVWQTLDKGEAPAVPLRLGAKTLHKHGLWANYAMDREEKATLADWYRFAHGSDKRYGKRLGVNLDGWLAAQPAFVVDGERRGLRFDGETQFGNLSPRACDLSEMTLALALKWEGAGSQMILDIGSSRTNCLVLRTDGAGKPEVVATVNGNVVARAAHGRPLPTGVWVRLRIESDGKALSLWVDGERVASQATTFRPCDAFAPGGAKRHVVAAAREVKDHFKGAIDYIVVYHTVHEDFDALPPPTRDAPTRPTKEFIASVEKAYGNLAVVNEKIKEGVEERNKPFEKLRLQKDARYRALLERSPEFLKAEAALEAAKKTVDAKKKQLAAEFAKTPDAAAAQAEVDAMKKQVADLHAVVRKFDRAMRQRQDALRKALRRDAQPVREHEALRKKLGQMERTLRDQREGYVAKATMELAKSVGQAEAALAEARTKAMLPYGPERMWMDGFQYQGYRGYYNTPYKSYLGSHVKALVGGGEMRENLDTLNALHEAHTSGKGWHTTVDWEWRMKQEVDGSIKELPLMQKWLVRVRGE